jgi:hypothetical protein
MTTYNARLAHKASLNPKIAGHGTFHADYAHVPGTLSSQNNDIPQVWAHKDAFRTADGLASTPETHDV